ncbi:hypothetical protein EVAR_96129_1 [Eumeta japonica]|uniref:Uncharacterized protein n=1 Tax=Eumeta variegata TaxID=151549 RepID=A0A4C2A476_EUMVA|nr:hypothetical protein EVAR_96129_1 [Eumeta japonica]
MQKFPVVIRRFTTELQATKAGFVVTIPKPKAAYSSAFSRVHLRSQKTQVSFSQIGLPVRAAGARMPAMQKQPESSVASWKLSFRRSCLCVPTVRKMDKQKGEVADNQEN